MRIGQKLPAQGQQGFTLLEMLIALTISALLMAALSGMVNTALTAQSSTKNQHDSLQEARFAMQRMTSAVRQSRQLLLPLNDDITTTWSESVRNVLAVSLEVTLDNNKDGWADANNDRDFLDVNNNGIKDTGEPERIDEDLGQDITNDGVAGIIGIDDDNDGKTDDKGKNDSDEDGKDNEDNINGLDDDNDGSIDEDPDKDMNGDGKPGIKNFDDDSDTQIDEGNTDDDDEDGVVSEDWIDPHVFYLSGNTLMERLPIMLPATGKDYTESVIAENVSQFRVEKVMAGNASSVLVDITLTLSPSQGSPVTLNTQIAVAGGL